MARIHAGTAAREASTKVPDTMKALNAAPPGAMPTVEDEVGVTDSLGDVPPPIPSLTRRSRASVKQEPIRASMAGERVDDGLVHSVERAG